MNELELLKNSILFDDIEQMEFQALLRCLNIRIKSFKSGEIIEYEGNPAKHAYLILKGHARTIYFDENGNNIPGYEYLPNNIFGLEFTTRSNNSYTEEFVAVKDTTVAICNLFRLLNPCENKCLRHTKVLSKCLSEYARLLKTAKSRIYELLQTKTREKILIYLAHNIPCDNEFHKIPYNRQELANYLGVERTALSAQLSALKKEGFIDYKKSDFMLKKFYRK